MKLLANPTTEKVYGRPCFLPVKVQLDNINELEIGKKYDEWSNNEWTIYGYFLTAIDVNKLHGIVNIDYAKYNGVKYESKNG